MRFGVCTNWFGAGETDKFEFLDSHLTALDNAGYDFVELGVGMLAPNLTDAEFKQLVSLTQDHKVTVDAFNVFIPAAFPLVGPDRKLKGALEYVDFVAERMAGLGGEIVVFGSGGARRIPEGVERADAEEHILEFIHGAAPLLATRNITMVLEPLNHRECNILNSVGEAKAMLTRVQGQPNVKLLADLYHMLEDDEAFDVLDDTEGTLTHVHVADTGRVYPGAGEADFPAFKQHLDLANYNRRISVECKMEDFSRDVKSSIEFLRSIWK